MKCDLHIHTNCSDGAYSPEEVVEIAKKANLSCISITDHDSVAGVSRAMKAGKAANITVLSGIEISTVFEGLEMHILGYNFDVNSGSFERELSQIADMRNQRNAALVEKLNQNGFNISLQEISKKTKGSIGRPDIGRELVKKGYCADISEAFDKFIGKDKPYYVQTKRLTPCEAIEFVTKNGGVSVLAHPRNLHMTASKFEETLKKLTSCGLSGIEAEYFTHTRPERKYFSKLAKKYDLIITGGSDFHDKTHGALIGGKNFSPSGFTKRVLNIK